MDIKLSPAPEWTEKAWGSTKCIFLGNNFEVHELHVKAGGFCSRHRHRKWNRFHVMTGKLKVEQFATPESPAEDRILEPGDFFLVAPEVIHRFVALDDCHLMEIYWTTDISPTDIERFDEGGMLSENTEKRIES